MTHVTSRILQVGWHRVCSQLDTDWHQIWSSYLSCSSIHAGYHNSHPSKITWVGHSFQWTRLRLIPLRFRTQSWIKCPNRRRDPRWVGCCGLILSLNVFIDWIKQTFGSTWHTIGACSMLPRSKGGVVGPDLKVNLPRALSDSNCVDAFSRSMGARIYALSIFPLHLYTSLVILKVSIHLQLILYGLLMWNPSYCLWYCWARCETRVFNAEQ